MRKKGARMLQRLDGVVRILATAGKSAVEIAELAGVAVQTVRRYCKESGVLLKRPVVLKSKAAVNRDKALCDLFKTGKTLEQVGQAFGITRERVRQVLVKNGITERYLWTFKNSGNRDEAMILYAAGEPLESLAALFGKSASSIITSFESSRALKKRRRINTFWRMVAVTANPDKCWNWQGGVGPGGHGRTSWLGRGLGTHVIAYIIANECKPAKWVLRDCDNPRCCNPKHLKPGTAQDNVRDRDERGRGAYQKGTGGPKLWIDDVEHIRRLLGDGVTQMKVAEIVGVNFATVNLIHTGKSWSDPRGMHKLRKPTFKMIYEGLQDGSFTQAHVSRFYDLHPKTVQSIKRGTNWRVKKILAEARDSA